MGWGEREDANGQGQLAGIRFGRVGRTLGTDVDAPNLSHPRSTGDGSEGGGAGGAQGKGGSGSRAESTAQKDAENSGGSTGGGLGGHEGKEAGEQGDNFGVVEEGSR